MFDQPANQCERIAQALKALFAYQGFGVPTGDFEILGFFLENFGGQVQHFTPMVVGLLAVTVVYGLAFRRSGAGSFAFECLVG